MNNDQFDNRTKYIVGFIVLLASFGLLTMIPGIVSSQQQKNAEKEKQQDEDRKAVENQKNDAAVAVQKVSKIEGQKIVKVEGGNIELENGTLIQSPDASKNTCIVGDIIDTYDESKQSLICSSIPDEDGNKDTRVIYVPAPTQAPVNNGGGGNSFLTNLILWDYLTGNRYMRNNGYNRDYDYNSGRTTYQNPTGTTVETGKTLNKDGKVEATKPVTTPKGTTPSKTSPSKTTPKAPTTGHGTTSGSTGNSGSS